MADTLTKLEEHGLAGEVVGLRENGLSYRSIADLIAARHGIKVSYMGVRKTLMRCSPREETAVAKRIAKRIRRGEKPPGRPRAKVAQGADGNGNGRVPKPPPSALAPLDVKPPENRRLEDKSPPPRPPSPPRPPGPDTSPRGKLLGLADHTSTVWEQGRKTVSVPRGVLRRLWANSMAPTAAQAEGGEPYADGKTLDDLGWVITDPRVLQGPDDDEVLVTQIVPLKSQLESARLASQALATIVRTDRPAPPPAPARSGDTNVNVGVGVKCEAGASPSQADERQVDLRKLPRQTIVMIALGIVPDVLDDPTPPSREVVEAAIERTGEDGDEQW